jgi:hypothetical protein
MAKYVKITEIVDFFTKYIFIISPSGFAIPYREVVSPTMIRVSCDKLNG